MKRTYSNFIGFAQSRISRKSQCCKDRELREMLSEKQIDQMLIDTFPASDPLATY